MMPKRPWLDLWVDAIALLILALLLATGWVLQFSLPHGSPAQGLALWGWDRHQWGELHTWASWAFLGAMGLHLWLHWTWIRCMSVGGEAAPPVRRRLGWAALAVLGLALLAAFALPWVSQPEQQERPAGRGEGRGRH